MTATNFPIVMAWVFKHEGGLSLDKRDPGNWTGGKVGKGELRGTKFGISAAAFPNENIAGLTKERATTLYKKNYWDRMQCDRLPAGVDYVAFDGAVNSGPRQSALWLQRAAGVPADGIVGEQTLAAVRAAAQRDEIALVKDQCAQRLKFMQSLKTWNTYKNGWTSRVNSVRANAIRLAEGDSEFGAVLYVQGMEAKARPADASVLASAASKVKIGTTAATVAAAVAQTTDALTPFADFSIVNKVLLGLAVVGAVTGVVLMLTRKGGEDVHT